jgi:hypothetical protein
MQRRKGIVHDRALRLYRLCAFAFHGAEIESGKSVFCPAGVGTLLVGFCAVWFMGCGPGAPRVAPISGRVTLDGQPLPKASVTFVPMATKENPNPGPTAQGMTDDDGRYQISVDVATPGAVVGQCRIYITTILSDPALDDRDAGGPIRKVRDKVPPRYNTGTELVFAVPAGGTDQANFELTSN